MFAGVGSPYWNQEGRESIFGMTRGTTRTYLARAVLEAIAYQNADVSQTLENDLGMKLTCLRADGGASKNNLLMQFQADSINKPVEAAYFSETTALGVTYLAGLAIGFWTTFDEIKQRNQVGKIFEPQLCQEERNEKYSGWQVAVSATINFKK